MAFWLVTGGLGFIGSHLAQALTRRGDRVRIVDDLSTGRREHAPPGAEVVIGDVVDPAVVAEAMAGVDGCFHLAAIASVQRCTEDWAASHRVNLGATVNLFEAARRATTGSGRAVPVVYASSAAVYGDNPDQPLTEQAATRPLSAYGADKLGCELHGRVAARVHGVPNTGFRFFNVYGPRQDPKSPYSGVIAIFADRLGAGQPITIFGDGGQVRDFVFVDDVVAHLLAGMAAPASTAEVYNVCTGRPTSVADLARIIGEILGVEPEIQSAAPRPGDIRTSIGNPAAAASAFGLEAEIEIRDGLARTLAWTRRS